MSCEARSASYSQRTLLSRTSEANHSTRPVKRPAPQQPLHVPPTVFPVTPPSSDSTEKSSQQIQGTRPRDSAWTYFSTPIGQSPAKPFSSELIRQASRRPNRSLSQSTIEAPTTDERSESGAFKIVIDRSDLTAKRDGGGKDNLPALEVSIPHYRLGTPRFSARGTAFLHSSIYTRSSTNEELLSVLHADDRMFVIPTGMESRSVLSRRHSHTSPQTRSAYGKPVSRSSVVPAAPPSQAARRPEGSITPQIFDALAANPDDPSIVRYAPTGEITAASPARIVAQITSENFLDYELLSDFFLTARAYLSTHDLLAYLVSRFEWAINRFDDNGRVIRVRAFAALRHWILNYFSYDFVHDRDLRTKFCDRLNVLTRIVQARANYGASDMKLIADLKKCWNGRCLIYWDTSASASESQQDGNIQPGGIVGSRDSQLSHPEQLGGDPATVIARPGLVSNEASSGQRHPREPVATQTVRSKALNGHHRHASTGTIRSLPISPTSDLSIPATSCSIPTKGLKKMAPYANRALGIHPVPTTPDGRRVCPAATSASANDLKAHPFTAHRRSGSFSDAARDKREPLSSERPAGSQDYGQMAYPNAGSLVRGYAVSPGTPLVKFFAPTTPALELPHIHLSSLSREGDVDGNRKVAASNNPGVKQLLGNIRRALSSKHANNGSSSNIDRINSSAPTSLTPKGAELASKAEYQAVSRGPTENFRCESRIDLLAAEITKAFDQVMNMQTDRDLQKIHDIDVISESVLKQPSLGPSMSTGGLRPPTVQRMDSGVTNGSRSVFIVDDTRPSVVKLPPLSVLVGKSESQINRPTPHLFPVNLPSHFTSNSKGADHGTSFHSGDARLEKIQQERRNVLLSDGDPFVRDTRQSTLRHDTERSRRPSILTRGQSYKSSCSGSTSLRRYASFQSTFSKKAFGRVADTSNAIDSGSNEPFETLPTRILRRRPGGDLRANQNVHDLKTMTRPRSTGSITTYTDSLRYSEIQSIGPRVTKAFINYNPNLPLDTQPGTISSTSSKLPSLVRTHSSQPALRRPSFDAVVAEFARIPDDEEGGVEAALLKLEGKYPKSLTISPLVRSNLIDVSLISKAASKLPEQRTTGDGTRKQSTRPTAENLMSASSYNLTNPRAQASVPETIKSERTSFASTTQVTREAAPSTIYAESEESYNSTPLLERGLEKSPPMPQALLATKYQLSGEAVDSESLRKLKHGSSAPTVTTDSFLLDEDDEFLSDLSSDLSDDLMSYDDAAETRTTPLAEDHPENTVLLGSHHPPSPPMTMENALWISSRANQVYELRKPPTPDRSPVSQHIEPHRATATGNARAEASFPVKNKSAECHIPFILEYDSEVLAQQFSLVEKDALNEIDWRDLVDMRWQNSPAPVTNWVNYLHNQDPCGIDLVTARFNIVVKWAISEIVLTQSIEERALVIKKYIHVAQHSRFIHNYATLLQLTIALTSVDCTRLTKTWDLIPAAEKKILQELEDLVTPRRNFHNLRLEMEKTNMDEGCIPVIGRL